MERLHSLTKKPAAFFRTGQILIEVLVALGVIVVVVTTITLSTTSSLINVEFSRTNNQATQYAQQGMEVIRSLRNTELSTFTSLNGTYCLAENTTVLSESSTCDVNIDNTFKRSVVLEKDNVAICGGGTKATVTVAWNDGKCPNGSFCHNALVTSCIAVVNVVPGL